MVSSSFVQFSGGLQSISKSLSARVAPETSLMTAFLLAVPAASPKRREARQQSSPGGRPALPTAAAVPQGQAEDQRLRPRLHCRGFALCRKRHLQPCSQSANPGCGPGRWQEAPEPQCCDKEVCEEEVKDGMGFPAAGAAREGPSTQALHVAAQRLCEGEASPSILPKAATLGRSQAFPFILLQCLKSSCDWG